MKAKKSIAVTKFESHQAIVTPDTFFEARKCVVQDECLLQEIKKRLESNQKRIEAMLFLMTPEMREQLLSIKIDAVEPDLFDNFCEASKPQQAERVSQTLKRFKPPSTIVEAPIPPRSAAKRNSGFPQTIIDILGKARNGLTHRELMEQLKQTEHAARATKNGGKSYYNIVSKLIARNAIIRHATQNFHPRIYEALKASGNLPSIEPEMAVQKNSGADIALQVLRQHPRGLTGLQLRDKAAVMPGAPKSIEHHGQYIYNVLATLIGAGLVERSNNIYRIAEKVRPRVNGASGPQASGKAR